MLHPTLVVPLPGLGEELVERAEPLWRKRLQKEGWEVGGAGEWRPALERLLSLDRILSLRAKGVAVDPSLNLVLLTRGGDEGLPTLVQELEETLLRDKHRDLEVRLHLVLILREPEDLQGLQAFPPDPRYPLTCRVWPVSYWSRDSLHLAREEYLYLWVQHFVEALVQTEAPLDPQIGRDWVGLGIARLEWAKPKVAEIGQLLWEKIQHTRLGPAPEIPPPPACPSLDHKEPILPERTECRFFPQWRGKDWEEFRQKLFQKGEKALDTLLFPWEASYPLEAGRLALLRGIPALKETRETLDQALAQGKHRREAALEELDRVLGLEGQRARLARLERRKARGKPVDPEELRRLREALAQVDRALESGDLNLFLQKDPEASQAQARLAELRAKHSEWQEKWDQMEESTKPPEPSGSQRKTVWDWLRARLGQPRPQREEAAEAQFDRKYLCDRGWAVLREAHEVQGVYTRRFLHYLELRQQVILLGGYREALVRERNRVVHLLEAVKHFAPRFPAEEENPLVLRVTAGEMPPELLRESAGSLVASGALEALWDQDEDALHQALEQEADRLAQAFSPPSAFRVPEIPWQALVLAASPRVRLWNWPEHRRYAYVLGNPQGHRWGEPYGKEAWLPGETVLLRMIYSLAPEHLAEEADPFVPGFSSNPPEGMGPDTPSAVGPPLKPPEEVVRDNPLVDALLTEVEDG
ncbi:MULTISPECIES: hypothetical protein [unclassified Meiothermus]|uniref:hypothetical protein n=1 Tax=unclassified Meiothermus TaxID=370471 RepID=UPI000D7C2755|nr:MULTISPECIES: hypothetical protein [unclassified Meiothermus]PZA06057.1 hypothetical protein DNA98_15490 [Meiothermus sp. Pnk-1]RYM36148.1 hypothetical protein EWH23_11060 [Meiothermus sp. PNK-Is4]